MLWPSTSDINDFKALPDSVKSELEGDTIQIPNVAAYFSDNYRDEVISFYLQDYQSKYNFPFPPLKLNHPPEYSWIAIKKHTDTTYLEELIYPLRDSFYINGFEPFYSDSTPKFWGATQFEAGDMLWETKTTLRFYPSTIIIRFVVWFMVILSMGMIYILGKRIIFEK